MRFLWPFLLLALTAAADEAADVACLLSARRPRRKRRHERQYQQGLDKNLSDWHYDSEGGTRQDIIIDNSEVYGNVIAGNNAGDIHSDFVENTVRDRSISAGDTEWSHDVFMPIGNTFKRFSVSANGTNINHTVNTDLGDNNTHTLGESATSRSFEDTDDSDDDT